MTGDTAWPALPLEGWQETYTTLHRWLQIVGKTRLALAPMQNHWWHVTLYPTPRGLSTSAMPAGDRALEIEFDFVGHELVVRTSDGVVRRRPLVAQSVAAFFRDYVALLEELRVPARIWAVPVELADTLPFTTDEAHASYDPDAAARCWRILLQVERVMAEFRSGFIGKCSPVHFWWGAFDIACTRFSGRPAPRHPGGVPNLADFVTREAYSHECISAGWWPGMVGGPVAEPAFYAYAYPEPPGMSEAQVLPAQTRSDTGLREWVLPYEAVRTAEDPDATLMQFLESTYAAAAALGNWPRRELERPRGSRRAE